MNCGECLMERTEIVTLVNGKCSKCRTDYTPSPEMPRHTTAHDRYQVCDKVCGLIETATSLAKALKRAQTHSCEGVEVFDTMARRDCAQTWDAKGNILAFRKD